MYTHFFGMKEKPFRNTPDPVFYYPSLHHREVLTAASQGIEDGCGLVVLIGEIGAGKTTLCRLIQNHCGYPSAFLSNPYLTEIEFLEKVNSELGIPSGSKPRNSLMDDLREYLVQQDRDMKRVILFVDEAHRLALPLLEQILMLSNFQLADAHLLQIVLVGQPELLDVLCHPRLASLNQRIGVRHQLPGMDHTDTIHYVNHRLEKAACRVPHLFSPGALEAIWKASGGTPRLINQLCERALVEAYHEGRKGIDRKHVRQLVQDRLYRSLFLPEGRMKLRGAALAAVLAALLFGVGFFVAGRFTKERARAAGAQVANSSHISWPEGELQSVPYSSREYTADKDNSRLVWPVMPSYGEGARQVRAVSQASSIEDRGQSKEKATEVSRRTGTADAVPISRSFQNDASTPPEPPGRQMSESLEVADHDELLDVKVTAIAWDEEATGRLVVLNEQILHEGEFFGDTRVLRILPDHVVLLRGKEEVIKRIHPQESGG
jgi:type II secretory pathway predicted ATPase ExeA